MPRRGETSIQNERATIDDSIKKEGEEEEAEEEEEEGIKAEVKYK